MAVGKVKWFNNAKGYGFILPDDGSEDLFVHYSAIEMEGYRTLKAGQEVEFDVVEGPKGLHAVNIQGHGDMEENPDDPAPSIGVSVEFQDDESTHSDTTSDPSRDASSG